jgi:SAM-dependent methyltransferase
MTAEYDARRLSDALAQIRPYVERARAFSGWAFDGLDIRHLDAGPPWDYEALARKYAGRSRSVVDLGTGGGEVLSRIVPGVEARVVATEEWAVNAPIAARRLAPLGVGVVRADSLRLPFAEGAFDLVLDRHEALTPADVARVVARGGTVLTQQVGNDNWPEFRQFVETVVFPDHFNIYQQGFAAAGLTIEDARWHEERVAFGSLGDVAYMMMVSPWSYPGFDAARDIERLLELEDALRTPDGIVVTESRYVIVARKPG